MLFLIVWPSAGSSMPEIPQGEKLKFQILRNGEPFGQHIINFSRDENKIKADIEINMKLGLAFVTLFRYEHQNTEVWKDGQLYSINARTNDNGNKYQVQAQRQDGKVYINGSGGEMAAEPTITAGTYWWKEMLDGKRILNTQTGKLKKVDVQKMGQEEVEVADSTVQADHYVVKLPERDIHVWYDSDTNQWVDLRFSIRGSQIDYKRLTPLVKSGSGSQ